MSAPTAYHVVSIDATKKPPRLLARLGGSDDYVAAWMLAGECRKKYSACVIVIDAATARLAGLA